MVERKSGAWFPRWPRGGAGAAIALAAAILFVLGVGGGIAQSVMTPSALAGKDFSATQAPLAPTAPEEAGDSSDDDADAEDEREPITAKETPAAVAVSADYVAPAPSRGSRNPGGSGSAGGGGASSGSSAGGGSSGGGSGCPAASGGGVLGATNAERAANCIHSLSNNGTLEAAACRWAQQMASENRMYHDPQQTWPSGARAIAENVAVGQRSAGAVVNAWMNSAGHRANILNPRYTMMGACSATGSDGRLYWAQKFAG